MNRTKEYWTLYCSILARVHRRNQSILFIHGVIYFFADIFLHSPAYLTDRLEFFYITSHDVYFNVYTQCTSFFIKPDPHVTFWYIAVTKFILTIHADRGTVKYYNRVLPSVKNQLHPRLFFLNMWAHLKTKGPQNSSQWTLAYQRAVTDSSKPLLCHCMWFCRHNTDQLTGMKHKENRFRLYTKGINSIMLRHNIRWHLTAVRLM